MKAINLKEKLSQFSKQWHPHIIDEGDSLQIYLSKIQGEFIMHSHENEDELFVVLKGKMFMCLTEKEIEVNEGEIILIPAGTEHCPKTKNNEEVHLLMIEPKGTTHTGNIIHERTIERFTKI